MLRAYAVFWLNGLKRFSMPSKSMPTNTPFGPFWLILILSLGFLLFSVTSHWLGDLSPRRLVHHFQHMIHNPSGMTQKVKEQASLSEQGW